MTSLTSRLAQFARARQDASDPAQAGDVRLIEGLTREELIEKYARKVNFVARRIMARLPAHAPLELDDLVNSGALGLLDAIDKFDTSKNTTFGTYVEFRIRGAILDLLRGLDPVSRTVREKATQVQRVTRDVELKLGRPAESEDVAEAMGLTLPEYFDLLNEVRSIHLVSLDRPAGSRDDEGGASLLDVIEDEDQATPDTEVHRKQAIGVLADAIQNGIPERLKHVLVMYYYREMNLKEIGEVLGVSESRVCQLHTEACLRLRSKLAGSLRPGESFSKTSLRASKKR
ncbi:MAG TPA: FliA/WhiG family RNA polymerase sigma factor [Deltaproteobacteria bacterium]|nr:FliA/WhiG family RNA polymerase sigma factor [Deltaproteobacteria bacterium]HCP45079.1 FliA/WhiG family RNA polymerase sigma factor [Deltaproteobacteria bacterium]